MTKTTKKPKPCKRGHDPKHRDKHGNCRLCAREAQKRYMERKKGRSEWAKHNDHAKVPEGYAIKGTSTLRKVVDPETGELVNQWQKTDRDGLDRVQAVLDAFAEVADSVRVVDPLPEPTTTMREDLLTVYPMGDPHLGLYAWAEETGDRNFDLETATAELFGAVDELVSMVPASKTAVVLPLGDTFHSDDSTNRTRRSGHALDVDGRYAKVARVGVQTMVRVVERALQRHEEVIFKPIVGNHDDESSLWLGLCLEQRYANEPRVTVDTSPCKFWYHRFGKVLLGSTHTDTVKAKGPTLAEVMACDRPEDWAATRYRYWYGGHIHQASVVERPGCVIETFPTLAARDSYAAGRGYRSSQRMQAIVHHAEYGELNRYTTPIARVMELAA